jgi:uncharacterized protein (DUF3820 family)
MPNPVSLSGFAPSIAERSGGQMRDETQKRFEIVSEALRYRLGWDARHDAMARLIMDEFALVLPRDLELIRQLTVIRIQQGEAHVMPFGKYKLRLLEEILVDDPAYIDWLAEQDWFRTEFPTLHQVIINFDSEN